VAGEADAGLRFEDIGDLDATGEMEVGDDDPEFLDGAGIVEKETLLLEALDPDRDRFLILDRNREVVPSFFSGFALLEPAIGCVDEPLAVIELGVAVPAVAAALLALAWSLNFF
jgi:hypothetical protein